MDIMNCNIEHINVHNVLDVAKSQTKNSNIFTYILGRCLHPTNRPFFYTWYAYFRRIDDFCDSDALTLEEKQQFLQQQTHLVYDFYDNLHAPSDAKDMNEYFLSLLISFDLKRGSKLKKPILELLSCISYDVERYNSFSLQCRLDQYIEIEVISYLKTVLYFCCSDTNLDDFPTPYEGIAGKWSHILRDFISDMQEGTINISKEEMEHYLEHYQKCPREIKSALNNSQFKTWVASKVKHAVLNFTSGKRNLHQHRCLRYKLIVCILCGKYEYYLRIIKKDQFKLREKYDKDVFDMAIILVKILMDLGAILYIHFFRYMVPWRKRQVIK